MKKSSNATADDIKKLFKMDLASFEIESQKDIYSGLDRLHYRTGINADIHLKLRENQGFSEFQKKYEKWVHQLIEIRNTIFKLQYKFKE